MLSRGDRIGDYILLNKVGSGGFGDVWKAEKRTALDVNYFALKFFRPKDDQINFENIRKELGVWKQLKGLGNIISVIELDSFEDFVYVVSDFADGGSLENWFKQNRKAASETEAVEITLQILKGLENLHEKGFVHRDLKPDNLLIMNGKLCLADFGISREVKTYSKATGTAGTVEYMPPEAFEKNPPVTPQTDIWAVGVILQRLLTGQLSFPQEMPALMLSILQDEPEPMPETISKGLHEIVKKALQKKRENRFQTAKEMRNALKNPAQFLASISVMEAKTVVDEDFERTKVLNNVPTFVIPQSQTAEQNRIQLEKEAAEKQQQEFVELERARQWREMEAEKERQRLRDLKAAEKAPQHSPDSKQNEAPPQADGLGKIFEEMFGGKAQNDVSQKPNLAQTVPLKSENQPSESDPLEWKIPAGILLICVMTIFGVVMCNPSKSSNFDKTKGRFSNNLVFNGANNSNKPANNSYPTSNNPINNK